MKELQDKIDALKTARGSEDAGTIKTATDALSQTLSKIGEAMANPSQNASGPSGNPPTGGNEGPEGPAAGPKDAEFKEKS